MRTKKKLANSHFLCHFYIFLEEKWERVQQNVFFMYVLIGFNINWMSLSHYLDLFHDLVASKKEIYYFFLVYLNRKIAFS